MNKRESSAETLHCRARELADELRRLTEMSSVMQASSAAPALTRDTWGPGVVLRRFIDANLIPIIRANVTGEFVEVNDAFVNLLGYSREELLNEMKWTDITPKDVYERDLTAIESLKKTGRAEPFEKQYIHKDGHLVPVLLGVSAMDSEGSDCFCLVIDLSARREAEENLRRSEAQFRLLLESIPQIIFVINKDQQLEYINNQWFDFTGFEQGQENEWPSVVHPDDIGKVLSMHEESFKTGAPLEFEVRHRSKDGVYRWALIRTIAFSGEDGQPLRYGTCTDIDEAKHAEYELRESEAELRTLADAIPQIVWTADADGSIDFFNQRWFEATGLTLEQSVNDGWQLLIHPEDLPHYLREWRKALMTGDTYEGEFRLRRAVGLQKGKVSPYRWHLGRAVALRNEDGVVTKWFATWTEIHSQKSSKA